MLGTSGVCAAINALSGENLRRLDEYVMQKQWRSQPKILGRANKFGGPKCLILGE